MDTVTPSVPAQTLPDTPPVLSAVESAVVDNDVAAFRSARHAERSGKPLPAPAAPPPDAETPPEPSAPVTPEQRTVSRRQQVINDYERRIAEQNERIARLEGQIAGNGRPTPSVQAPPAVAPAVQTDPEPDPADATKYPDGQYDPKFIRDLGAWSARQEHRTIQDRQRADAETARRETAQRERTRAFDTQRAVFAERVAASVEADPSVHDRIDPKLFELRPSITLREGEAPTFGHAVADVVLESADPIRLMLHLSDPAEARRLAALPPEAFYREIGRIEARFETPAAPASATPAPKTMTSAPAPPVTLGSKSADTADPVESAVASGDVGAFRKARMAQRTANLR